MRLHKILLGAGSLLALSHPATAIEVDPYGSLRLGVEAVSPDGNVDDDYTGFRDAYSRVGLNVSQALQDEWTISAKVEIPLDLANFDVHSPDNNTDHLRVAKIQIASPLGTLWYGKGWMAYYNAIAYPVDYFSSYYSGWATPTTFRRQDTLYYSSPSFGGFSVSAATTNDNGGISQNRNQYTASYSNSGLTISAGLDDNTGDTADSIMGLAVSYTTGAWYAAAKYEEMDTNDANDGGTAMNLLLQYALDDKNTLRGMIADVDLPNWGGYGDTVVHVGWDHQYNSDLKVFLEYYMEESTAAISTSNDSFSGVTNGGQVVTAGVRYDF